MDEDFLLFQENESLGVNIKPAFKPFLYSCAKEAFSEAWVRGVKWGWAQSSVEANQKAQDRMRQTMDLVYPHGMHQATDLPVMQAGVPKQETMDMTWFRSVIGHMSLSHLKVYGSLHGIQNKSINEKYANIVRFYQSAMTVAWRSGWSCGEQHAKDQYKIRNTDQSLYQSVEDRASDMEQEYLEDQINRLFEITNEDIDLLEKRLDEEINAKRQAVKEA